MQFFICSVYSFDNEDLDLAISSSYTKSVLSASSFKLMLLNLAAVFRLSPSPFIVDLWTRSFTSHHDYLFYCLAQFCFCSHKVASAVLSDGYCVASSFNKTSQKSYNEFFFIAFSHLCMTAWLVKGIRQNPIR